MPTGKESNRQVAERVASFQRLEHGWDSYQARCPEGQSLDFALQFLRDSIGVLLDYGIEAPTPFLVSDAVGGSAARVEGSGPRAGA